MGRPYPCRHEGDLTIQIGAGGEIELRLTVDFDFTPGEPETGRYGGRPEDYDSGSGPEIWITGVRLFGAGDVEHEVPAWLRAAIDADDDLREALAEAGAEYAADEHERAADHRADMAREERLFAAE